MTLRHRLSAFAVFSGLFLLGGNVANAAVTYVDATTANTTHADGVSTWSTSADASDGLWWVRPGQGVNGEILVASNSGGAGAENAAEIKTTLTGLTNGNYNVWVVYDTQGTSNWSVRAGFTSNAGANQIFDTTAAADIAGAMVGTDVTLMSWVGGTPTSSGEVIFAGALGQYNVTAGTITVFVDDLPRGATTSRTWYDGLAFESLDVPIIDSQASGLHTNGSTWTDNLPPASGKKNRVVSGHTVEINGTDYAGDELIVASNGIVNFSASGTSVNILKVEAGGNLTESVSGDFFLGDIAAPGGYNKLETAADLTFTIDSGAEFGLDMKLSGTGNVNFNAGTDSTLYIAGSEAHDGIIRFNGTSGGEVLLLEDEPYHFLEMNSPGAMLIYEPVAPLQESSKVTFNETGTIVHNSTVERLQGVATLVANADVTLDLTQAPVADEKRFLTSANLQGTEDLHVTGPGTTPPSGVTANEFEIGSQGTTESEPAGNLTASTISGTITLDGYVNMETRHHLRNAKVVVNDHAVFEMGHMIRISTKSVEVGEIEVNSGGILEVGMEKSEGVVNGHFAYHLTLDDSGGKSGGLTLHDGAQLNMQINGGPTSTSLFDRISTDGGVALNGTLNILVNPQVCIGNTTCNVTNYTTSYTPNAGDTWTLIETPVVSPLGDYNLDGSVNTLDYDEWKEFFGTNNANADGNKDGTVNAADFIVWQKNVGQTGSGLPITGTFDSIVDDLAGFHFVGDYSTPGKFKVTLMAGESGGGGNSPVPEPSTFALAGLMLLLVGLCRRPSR